MSNKQRRAAARKGWETRRRHLAAQVREEKRRHAARVEAAQRGWETRKRQAREQAEKQRRRKRKRQRQADAKDKKEATRLRKWRASYRKYLEFKLPKKEREQLETPAKKELVCRVLFDAEATDVREEHIWVNLEMLLGQDIKNALDRIPATDGIVRAVFRLIDGEQYEAMQHGTSEDVDAGRWGELIPLEWESEFEVRPFWSAYYSYARSLLPNRAERKGQDYKASWLGVVRLEVCFEPGQAEE